MWSILIEYDSKPSFIFKKKDSYYWLVVLEKNNPQMNFLKDLRGFLIRNFYN